MHARCVTESAPWRGPSPRRLVHHVAEQDVQAVASLGGSGSSGSLDAPAPLSVGLLPPRLRECLVDPALVEYLRWPNGKLQELGSGARCGRARPGWGAALYVARQPRSAPAQLAARGIGARGGWGLG